ncbi:MAG: cyclase [Desulfurococcales archaeon ex4484_217_2]|nr:MAG: cyclase [Desulfurococcales archaeon ex4484_217_2]
MKIIDLSFEIYSGAPVFPGYPIPIVHKWTSIEEHGYYSNLLMFVEHTLTHVDVPAHFVKNGATVEQVSLDKFMGNAVVIDVSNKPPKYEITPEDIELQLKELNVNVGPGWILLFYTGYDRKIGTPEFFNHPGLGWAASKYITELEVNGIGFDAPSVDHPPFPAHKTLLPKGIVLYENLTNLDKLVGIAGFKFIGLPLKIKGGSASPVRAIAVIEEE